MEAQDKGQCLTSPPSVKEQHLRWWQVFLKSKRTRRRPRRRTRRRTRRKESEKHEKKDEKKDEKKNGEENEKNKQHKQHKQNKQNKQDTQNKQHAQHTQHRKKRLLRDQAQHGQEDEITVRTSFCPRKSTAARSVTVRPSRCCHSTAAGQASSST